MTDQVIALAVALTVGVVWAVRQTGYIPDRFVPLMSLIIGSGCAYALKDTGWSIATDGIQVGLMASGAWSGVKNTFTASA